MIKATEARDLSNRYKDSFNNRIKDIEDCISKSIQAGKFHTTCMLSYVDDTTKIQDYLINLGYSVEFEANNFINIKW